MRDTTFVNKKILVTGADGFIGSHLVEALIDIGADVTALSFYNSFNQWGWLDKIPNLERVKVKTGDIRDSNFCRQLTNNIEIIFNLAALIAIPYSYIAPSSYIDTNIKGTLNICQSALENGCKLVQISTSEVYGSAKYVPIDENHPLQPQSPYSASKIGSDAIAMSFYNSFNLPVILARPFNTYGPRQSARAIIPTVITQINSGLDTIKIGDPKPSRDFTYVEDTCRGLIELAMCEEAIGKTINIGTMVDISIGELVEKIISLRGRIVHVITDEKRVRPPKSEVVRLLCDNRKLVSLTGFKPKISLDEGLVRTINWFNNPENMKYYKPEIYNV